MKKIKRPNFRKYLRPIFAVFLFFLITLFLYLNFRTGIFDRDYSEINIRDLKKWNYSSNKIISGAESFYLNGSMNVCWILIHGYGATPLVMKELATKINRDFGDFIYAPRLKGHGAVPENLLNYSIKDWYFQVEKNFENLSKKCKTINLVGSSFGGAIALKLAEEKKTGRVYLANSFLRIGRKWYYPLSGEDSLRVFSKIFLYSKKRKVAQINSLLGLKKHIAYVNMPFLPIVNSLKFIRDIEKNLFKITEPVFIFHSINDRVAWVKSADLIYNNLQSRIKRKDLYLKSNHILLMDYDKEEIIEKILKYEKEFR